MQIKEINTAIRQKKALHLSTISENVTNFLSETETLMERLDDLPAETVDELYDMYQIVAQTVTTNISITDPELRVKICERQDRIIERVVDLALPFVCHKHSIYTPAIQGYRHWSNVELMKDPGLSGYMLAKVTGGHPVIFFGTKPTDYPYLTDMPGMKILYNNATGGGMASSYYKHLIETYSEMDTIIFYGMYDETLEYLNAYRQLRPDGKVYCGLDMNSHWMGRIPWGSAPIKRFASQCDLITTSCRSLRDALNHNPTVHFPCRWFTNGFLNLTKTQIIADPLCKENIILTVGRIGTAQKNNAELLQAFALISNYLPEWKMRLVGSIEPEFHSFIKQYFNLMPDLKKRVIFTEEISNKAELYKEYKKAKIYVFTSILEGFPNVYAEALFHGCMFVTSDIDAADDITNYGKLGTKYKLGDVRTLAAILSKMCSGADVYAFQKHIPLALDYAVKYFDWNRNAKKLAYMLYKK